MAPATFIRPCMKATDGSSVPATTARASASVRVTVRSAPSTGPGAAPTTRRPAVEGGVARDVARRRHR